MAVLILDGGIMKRLSNVMIWLIVMSKVFAFSQLVAKESHRFQGCVGIELASFRDDLIVPLGFHGPGVSLGVNYQYNSEKWKLEFPIHYKFDYVQNRFAQPGITFSLDLKPVILKPLFMFENHGQFQAGLAVLFKINNFFPYSWDDAHLYWFTIKSAALALKWNNPISEKRAFSVYIEIPFISHISRPPVYRLDKQDEGLVWLSFKSTEAKREYKTATISDYQSILIRGNYQRTQRSTWSIEFEFDHYSQPKAVWAISTSLYYSREMRSWK